MLLLVPGLAAVVFALMEATIWAGLERDPGCVLLGGGALLAAFVVDELRAPEPLVDLRLLRNRALASDGGVVFLVQFALVGLLIYGAILDQKLSPSVEALLPTALAILLVAPSAGRLYDRVGARRPLTLGSAIAAAGLAWTGLVIGRLSYAWLVPGYIAVGVGIALTSGPAKVDALTAAGPALRGQAAGLMQLLRQLGGVFGLAVIGTVVAAVQHDRLSDSLAAAGVPQGRIEGLQRILVEDPTSQRAIAADITPGHLGASLRIARDGLVEAIGTAYYVAAGVVLVAGLVVLVLELRRSNDVAPPPDAVGAR